jgi:hypothetical protein
LITDPPAAAELLLAATETGVPVELVVVIECFSWRRPDYEPVVCSPKGWDPFGQKTGRAPCGARPS